MGWLVAGPLRLSVANSIPIVRILNVYYTQPPRTAVPLMEKSFSKLLCFVFLGLGILIVVPFAAVHAAQSPPQIISYQGRLADSDGDLLGSASGTSYNFKFSIWSTSTVDTGTQLWPASGPTSYAATVRQGVFNVNIGDTANGYPDSLNLDFSTSTALYLQVEVDNGSSFEELSPRQRITSVVFSLLSGAVSGTGQSSFGTTTPITNSMVTIEATSTQAIGLSIRGIASQLANLFQIQNSAGTNLFVVNNSGNVGVGTTTATRKFNVFDSSSAPQFRVSQGDSVYGELYVVPVTGDLRISSTGGNIRQNNENLWVCSGDGCAMDATPPAGQGNLIVENSFIFDNGFKFKQDSASTTMYDALDNPILQFDDGE